MTARVAITVRAEHTTSGRYAGLSNPRLCARTVRRGLPKRLASPGIQMTLASNIAISIVALIHVYILVLEMFLWDKPAGLRAFGQTQEAATASKVLAANQGLYNGFLAAGP